MIFFKSVDCNGCVPCPTGPCNSSPPIDVFCYIRTASTSLSKCGFTEWAGYESTPPKYYFNLTLDGTVTLSAYDYGCGTCITAVVDDYYGYISVDALTCVETGVPSVNEKVYENCTSLYSDYTYPAYDVTTVGWVGNGFTESYTSTTHSIAGTNICTGDDIIGTGTAYAWVSNEYTTAELTFNALSSLPAFSGVYYVNNPLTDYAYYDLSTDEVTATVTKMEYYIAWDATSPSYCLQVTWAQRNQTEAGIVSYASFTFSTTGSTTWTGLYTISPPATQGKTTVVSVAITCLRC